MAPESCVAEDGLVWHQWKERPLVLSWLGRVYIYFFVCSFSFSFFFFFRFIYLYEYIVAVFGHTRRGHQIPLQMVVSHHVECWELNLGPLEEQSVLLTTEPSLQPPHFLFNNPRDVLGFDAKYLQYACSLCDLFILLLS